jgi:flavin reductase (DIM6/NTAB) family NADH-FMN oxidoreductase RutF
MNESPSPDIEAFKQAFRRHAAGVSIVTSLAPDGHPVGFTATSLASLAADPPLASFNMARISSAWPAIVVGNLVAIHTLGPRTQWLAELMAADHDARFSGDHWKPGPHGVPILDGVTSWMLGPVVEFHPVADNAVVIVRIEEGQLGENDDALLYHERTYMKPSSI